MTERLRDQYAYQYKLAQPDPLFETGIWETIIVPGYLGFWIDAPSDVSNISITMK
jgi:hypothetical protein